MSHTGLSRVGRRGTDSYVGWSIPEDPTGNGFESAYDVYNAGMAYGRKQLTTLMLFDNVSKQVVSNDPAHILLMINDVFNEWAENEIGLYPEGLHDEIEAVNAVPSSHYYLRSLSRTSGTLLLPRFSGPPRGSQEDFLGRERDP